MKTPEYIRRARREYTKRRYEVDPEFRARLQEYSRARHERITSNPELHEKRREQDRERCQKYRDGKKYAALEVALESFDYPTLLKTLGMTCDPQVIKTKASEILKENIECQGTIMQLWQLLMRSKRSVCCLVGAIVYHCICGQCTVQSAAKAMCMSKQGLMRAHAEVKASLEMRPKIHMVKLVLTDGTESVFHTDTPALQQVLILLLGDVDIHARSVSCVHVSVQG